MGCAKYSVCTLLFALVGVFFFFSSRRRHTRFKCDWSSDVCSSDLVLFVADVNRALRFYIDMLGFEKDWHEGDGAGGVCQVHRAGCEIILCEDATRTDKARLFVALNVDGLTAFRREIVERSVPTEKSWWSYDLVKIVDPDGNELLFPVAE